MRRGYYFNCPECRQRMTNDSMANTHAINGAVCKNYKEVMELIDEHDYGIFTGTSNLSLIKKAEINVFEIEVQSALRRKDSWNAELRAFTTTITLAEKPVPMMAELFKAKVFRWFLSQYTTDEKFACNIKQASKLSSLKAHEFVQRKYMSSKLDIKSEAVRGALIQLCIDTSCFEVDPQKIEGDKNMVAVNAEQLDLMLISIRTLKDSINDNMKRKDRIYD
jgi:hypothetical protein